MICPQCGSDTEVTGNMDRKNRVVVNRVRKCLQCGVRFVTAEAYVRPYKPTRGQR